ncbi:MAG: hypothetical protein AB1513_08510 [Pseudomonadota bacterium]
MPLHVHLHLLQNEGDPASRGIERDNWHLLTGSDTTTKEFAALVGIKYWYTARHSLHDLKIVRLNGDGVITGEITEYDIDPGYLLQYAAVSPHLTPPRHLFP